MSDEKALLAAIWAEPQEDTPRLVYADWLQETGDPVNVARAEFIRIQCQRAQLEDDDPQQPALEEHEERLWKKHAKSWKSGLPKLLQAASFHRGFPHPRRRAMTGAKFLKLTMEELASAPLWDFNLDGAQKSIEQAISSTRMARVGTLALSDLNVFDREKAILASANFQNLHSLMIGSSRMSGSGMEALVANPSLRHLQQLSLFRCCLTDSDYAHLVKATWFPLLRSLSLGHNQVGDSGLHALINNAASGTLRQLSLTGRHVDSPHRRFDDESIRLLFGAPQMRGLRSLELDLNALGDDGLHVLCACTPPFRLRRLHLGNNHLTDAAVEGLASWPGLEKVEMLALDNNQITRAGAVALTRSPHLGKLETLWLVNNPVFTAADWPTVQQTLIDRFGEGLTFHW